MVETDDPQRIFRSLRRAQHRQHICRRAESDIPDHEFVLMRGEPFRQAQLLDIQRLCLRYGANDRMKRLAFRQRMDAMNATGEFDNFITGSLLHTPF